MFVVRFISKLFRRERAGGLDYALERMDVAIERFRLAAEMTDQPHARLFWDLAAAGAELRAEVAADPAGAASMRRFLFFHIPKMSELCFRWAQIAQADPLRRPDESALEDFRSYLRMIRAAKEACASRRYDDLHLTMEALDDQLRRLSA